MAYTLPELPYAYAALEPQLDARTMEIHHTKHHAAYLAKLNAALETAPELADRSIESLLQDISALPSGIQTVVRNNGGGFYNHALFWSILAPASGQQPTGELADRINQDFGSLADLQEKFSDAAANRFGSGWAWLAVDTTTGKLFVSSTPNQDNPLMAGHVDQLGTPILGLDVWEHAYYLNYQNRRPDYIAAFWQIVNWTEVANRYAASSR